MYKSPVIIIYCLLVVGIVSAQDAAFNVPFLTAPEDSSAIIAQMKADSIMKELTKYYNTQFSEFREYLTEYPSLKIESDKSTITTREDTLAFWINIYNALAVKTVLEMCFTKDDTSNTIIPYEGIWENEKFLSTEYQIGDSTFSLLKLKNNILRRFHDPRIHFVILPDCFHDLKPVEGKKLKKTLDKAASRYINDLNCVALDTTNHTLNLSKLFDLYSQDFARSDGSVISFLMNYLPPEQKAYLEKQCEEEQQFYNIQIFYNN